MGKRLAAVGMAAAIGVGGLAVAAVNPLGVAGATSTTTTQTAPTTAGEGTRRDGPLQRALAKLVADGTLTQAQADKVTETTKAEAKAGHQERRAQLKDRRKELVAVVAKAIGSTPEQVTAGLKDGTSIAKQAEAKGVDRKVVADAVTTALTGRIDAAVKDGTLTAERAATIKQRLPKQVDRILDADGHRAGRHRRPGN